MIVSKWITRELLTITFESPVTEAAEIMSRKRIRRLPVVVRGSRGDRPIGVLTATDVFHAFPPDVNPFSAIATAAQRTHTLVGEIVKSDPETVAPDAPIEQAAALMRDRKIGALPVVRDGRLVGLITESDIFSAFVSVFAGPHAGERLTFEVQEREAAFRFIAAFARKHDVRSGSLVTSRQHEARV